MEGQSAERSVHVLFESCHFEDCADIALRINRNGLATIINCTFVNKEDCVRVEGGRGAIIKHSSLSGAGGTGCAVKVYPKAKLLEIINCSIRLACVYLTRCKAVLVQGSCVGDTDMLFTGSVFRKAAIDDCTFSNCRDAISLIVGKASLTVTNCRFSRVQDCDFQVRQVVFGCVEISNCQRAGRLFIEEGTRCAVIIDGIPYTAPPKPKVPIPVEPGAGKAQWGKVASLRLSKKFGSERPILCFACDKVEPATVTFKLCSKCSKACYCSRECQVQYAVVTLCIC